MTEDLDAAPAVADSEHHEIWVEYLGPRAETGREPGTKVQWLERPFGPEARGLVAEYNRDERTHARLRSGGKPHRRFLAVRCEVTRTELAEPDPAPGMERCRYCGRRIDAMGVRWVDETSGSLGDRMLCTHAPDYNHHPDPVPEEQ